MSTKSPISRNSYLKYCYLLIILLVLLGSSPLVAPATVQAQSAPVEYQHFNTEMTLQEDGTLHVRMIQQIRFFGSFSEGFYTIPVKNVSSIGNVQVFGAATQEDNYVLD